MNKNKIIRLIVWSILFLMFLGCGIYGMILGQDKNMATKKLQDITQYFNNSIIVKNHLDNNITITATQDNNQITVNYTSLENNSTYTYTYTEGILNTSLDINDAGAKEVLKIMLSAIAENLGKNYADIALKFDTLDLETYTIDKGLNYIVTGTTASIRINTNTALKIEIIEDKFITINDLVADTETIKNGNYTKTKGDMIVNKTGVEIPIISISESSGLTENTYNSIISIIEILYQDSKIIDYFKSNYTSISEGSKVFKGFAIEINPDKNENEKVVFGIENTSPFIRVTINKEEIVIEDEVSTLEQ